MDKVLPLLLCCFEKSVFFKNKRRTLSAGYGKFCVKGVIFETFSYKTVCLLETRYFVAVYSTYEGDFF